MGFSLLCHSKPAVLPHTEMSSFQALTGLRGICSILIVCGHFFTNFAPVNANSWPSVSLDYFAPVTLFFVVSGFLLGVLYQDKLGEWKQRRVFWVKRFARLAPMYWFSLIFCLPSLIAYYCSEENIWMFIGDLVFTPLFVQSVTLVGNDWSGPLWQISAFALCYAIYPFTLRHLRSFRTAIVCSVVLFLVPLVALALGFTFGWPLGVIHTWAPLRAPQFFIGVILGLHFPHKEPQEVNERSGLTNNIEEAMDGTLEAKPSCIDWATVLLEIHTVILFASFIGCLILGTLQGSQYWWTYMLWEEFAMVPVHCMWIYLL